MVIRTSQLTRILSTVWNQTISPVEAFSQIDEYAVDVNAVSSILFDVWFHATGVNDALELLCNHCTVVDD